MEGLDNPVHALGSQGLQVARLGFGCMSLSSNLYGGHVPVPEEQATAVLRRAYDLGARLYNTSDLYGPYTNEELLGKVFSAELASGEVTIATKWGAMFVPGKGIVMDNSPENARRSCESALQRLGVQSIDLFTYRGPPPPGVPIEETMKELKALVEEGKVKYLGLSEVSPAQVRAAHAVHPITAVELEWSLFTRDVEEDLVPLCRELGIGILAYSPLGRGMLTGRLTSLDQLPDGDFRKVAAPRFAALEQNLALVKRVEAMAQRKGCTTGQLALAWLLAQGEDVFPIPGTKRVEYLEENMGALAVQLSSEDIRELEAAVPQSEVVGTRYADMKHTYRGSA